MDRGRRHRGGFKKKDDSDSLADHHRAAANRWPQFRGQSRDGRIAWLPEILPNPTTDLVWTATMASTGVGGLIVAGDTVIVSGRDGSDAQDVFAALDIDTGKQHWCYQYEAAASLDYGNSPRATPAFSDGVLVTMGATGVVCGLDVSTGVPLWKVELTEKFDVPVPTWGFSGSPLVIGGSMLIQVAENPSMVSLDLFTGEVRWQVSGEPAAYSSLMPIAGKAKVVGVTRGGYAIHRVEDGTLVWSTKPEYSGDFGVPSPVVAPSGLIFTSENNGIQLFPAGERYRSQPSSVHEALIPDSHTPVLVGNQLLVAYEGLHALDVRDSLQELWSIAENKVTAYASIVASDDRALVTTENGELLLFSVAAEDSPRLLARQRLTSEKASVLSHPAVHGARLLIRVGTEVRCYDLAQ